MLCICTKLHNEMNNICMDTDAEVAGVVVVDGLGMDLSETSLHGKGQDGSMDPALAGLLDIGEILE